MTITDEALIERALQGDRGALGDLVARHQPFVFNVALKMFGNRDDAEDLTQIVFVRVITSLGTFRGRSAFTTWLYRIAVNQFLTASRRGMELLVDDFASFFEGVAAVPEVPDATQIGGEVVEELRVRCTTGMLMCLDREQRLVYVLGAMFGVPHELAAEALDLTPGNFRVRLHRARAELGRWMRGHCGLVDPANPCRCRKKAAGYIQAGLLDPVARTFTREYGQRVAAWTSAGAETAMQTVDDLHDRIFQDHPVQEMPRRIVDEILENATLKDFFALA